jgi:hypothetical protein
MYSGEKLVLPVLGLYGGDLQELYKVGRKYFFNFKNLEHVEHVIAQELT